MSLWMKLHVHVHVTIYKCMYCTCSLNSRKTWLFLIIADFMYIIMHNYIYMYDYMITHMITCTCIFFLQDNGPVDKIISSILQMLDNDVIDNWKTCAQYFLLLKSYANHVRDEYIITTLYMVHVHVWNNNAIEWACTHVHVYNYFRTKIRHTCTCTCTCNKLQLMKSFESKHFIL